MIRAQDFANQEIPNHFKTIHQRLNSYRDLSTVIVIPTRGLIHPKVVSAYVSLITPPNQKRALFILENAEVAEAYENALAAILNDPELKSFKYLMTIEDDNTPPPMAQIQLLDSLTHLNFDAMSGLYFAKGEFGFPMAFGDPDTFRNEKYFDCRPRDVHEAVAKNEVLEVNAIAMGCAVWKIETLKQLSEPRFKTVATTNGRETYVGQTQDIFVSEKIRRAGGRVGVDCRVKVGHVDPKTGEVW